MTVPSGNPWLVRGGTAVGDCPVGRERELDEGHGLLTDRGGPRLVLVRGERGSGRTVFMNTIAQRMCGDGELVRSVSCVPGDGARPFLLALRLVMVLEERRPAEALRAAGRRDGAVMAALLRAALARAASVVVVLDDLQYADPESLALLGGTDLTGVSSGVRLLASVVGCGGSASSAGRVVEGSQVLRRDRVGGTVDELAAAQGARAIVLTRLGVEQTVAMVAGRLGATPDTGLVRRVRALTHGLPGAVDALLTGWTRQGVIKVADGHAFVGARTPTPVLPDGDRFMWALDALGEPCRTVAGALSVLWPLGARVVMLIAGSVGLSVSEVRAAVRDLAGAGIVEELPGTDGGTA
ncbi:ATP-binding protein [Streptomyces sp. N50]|uniref:ATP-binding protein n=1 Tax=Streptomyces sp. N50 TaxID=3081765 RepID=UPI0029621897|nr:ATP-binding protein [Streptomyces sp. N50]WOX15187.1 ATP-binding protein [Streptomyces sp. N50]